MNIIAALIYWGFNAISSLLQKYVEFINRIGNTNNVVHAFILPIIPVFTFHMVK